MKTVTIAMSGGQDPRLWCSPCNTLRWCLSDSAVTSRQHAAMDFRARRLSHRSAAGVVSRTKTCWVKCAEPIRSESHGRMQGKWQKRPFGVAGVACVQRGPSTLISYGIYIYIIWYWNILNTCMLRHFRDGFTPEYSILKVSHTHCADVLLYSYTTCWRTTAEYHQWNDANLSVGDHNLLT